MQSRAGPGKRETLPKKETKPKRARGMARVVEFSPSQCETLSSNPSFIHTHTKGFLKNSVKKRAKHVLWKAAELSGSQSGKL
jgi:hypothetical protein